MSSHVELESLKEIIKLNDNELEELLKILEEVWFEGNITIQTEDRGSSVFSFKPALDKLNLKFLKREGLSGLVSDLVLTAELLLRKLENGKIPSTDSVLAEFDNAKLNNIANKLYTSKAMSEIDYKMHNNSPSIDIISMNYNAKSYYPAHVARECPIVSINFKLNTFGVRKNVYVEMTKTELKQVLKELEDCKREMDNIQEKLDKKYGDKQ